MGDKHLEITSPESLVAIVIAARNAGDVELERRASSLLRDRFGVTLRFAREVVSAI